MKINSKLIILFICLIIMYLVAINYNWKYHNIQEKLTIVQNDLQIKEEALLDAQEELVETRKDLQFAIEKSDGLSTSLGNITKDLEDAQTIISDLKSEEYEFVYLGAFTITHYCDERITNHICGGSGVTASGKPTEVGWTAAADTSVLPMGSIIYISGYSTREIQDTGSAVAGHHIDILVEHHNEALELGVKTEDVWLLVKKSS